MAHVAKTKLFQMIASAIEANGWTVTPLSEPREHPFRFTMGKGQLQHQVRVYIWNVSHGGGAKRPRDEHRIQITRIPHFEPEQDGITLILGWSEHFGVFSAFDIAYHLRPLGSSPSIQIAGKTLDQARKDGLAAQAKGNDEVAIAIRPDHLSRYVVHRDAAHRGNIRALIMPNDDDVDFVEMANLDQPPHFGTLAEQAQRRTLLDRLTALEQELEAIKPQLGKIGHNNPPEAIGSEPETIASEITEATETIRAELVKPQPDVPVVARGASVLQRIWRMLRAVGGEAGKLGGAVKDKARDKAAELIVSSVVGGVLYGPQIVKTLESAVAAVGDWFRLLF
ncbi:hypothetical protein FY137_00570 [Agrobacterium tumefaciens]|nr:hypothetical protein FY137_00570 [Agrobacterium tumefaciens]